MTTRKTVNLTKNEPDETINWEVVLRKDEQIIQAISELVSRNQLFDFDKAFLTNLINWHNSRGFLTPKQSQSALKTLAKRYNKRLQEIYDAEASSFKAYINASVDHLDEEFVEVVDAIHTMMDCPICDKHKINMGGIPVVCNDGEPDRSTVRCDKCHTTITFEVAQ